MLIPNQKFVCCHCNHEHTQVVAKQPTNHGYPCPACGGYLAWPTETEQQTYRKYDALASYSFIIGLQLVISMWLVLKNPPAAVAILVLVIAANLWAHYARPGPIKLRGIDMIYPEAEHKRLDQVAEQRADIDANIAAFEAAKERQNANKAWWEVWR
ncbi:MAG: hypothetical protein ACE37D_09905 [Pseudomonadales bacterium]|jgi:hypothetical protein